jgi:hypothetical protein
LDGNGFISILKNCFKLATPFGVAAEINPPNAGAPSAPLANREVFSLVVVDL